MKYRNYTINKDDARNWKVVRFDETVATRDIKNKLGEITIKNGQHYVKETTVGFFSDVSTALNGVVRDCAGIGCETISDLAKQIKELKAEISELLK